MHVSLRTAILLISLTVGAHHATAAESSEKTLSMVMFTKLSVVENLMSQQEFEKAQKKLTRMLSDLPDRPTDKAYVYHSQATLFLYQEKYKDAQKYFTLSYELDALNDKTSASVAQTLASLAMHFGDFRKAITYLNDYLAVAEAPDKSVLLALGTAHYQIKEYAKAINPLKQAKAQFEPDKSVYLLLFSSYYELEQMTNAAGVLEQVIRLWPDETEYWLQLASIYLEQKKVTKSLEVLQLAFAQNLLLKEGELLQFVYTLYEKGLPFKASRVLQTGFDKGLIKKNYKNYSLLASLLVDARESDLALDAFTLASQQASDGKEDLYIAQIYFERESFRKAISHAGDALNKGIKNPGNAYMLMAASHHELDELKQAKANLLKASKYKKTKQAAEQWLGGLE
ncbi:MAG TPA: hypothetical protein DD979_03240 [Gammaproteobacteria bacterium]|nr:hypothetical protein [Gammaproteobacteria bacterium]